MTVSQDGRCSSALTYTNLSEPRVDRRPTSGRVELNGINYVYIPNANFTGGDRFVVSWVNARDGSRVALTVSVRIVPPGTPAPAASGSAAARPSPPSTTTCRYLANGAINNQMRFGEGTMVVGRNRSCQVTLTGIVVDGVDTQPSNGRVEINGGHYSYRPNQNFTGSDRFSVNYNVQGRRIINFVNVQVVP